MKQLTTAEVANRLGVTVSTVNRMVTRGEIEPAVQFPGRTGARLFTEDEVERVEHARNTAA